MAMRLKMLAGLAAASRALVHQQCPRRAPARLGAAAIAEEEAAPAGRVSALSRYAIKGFPGDALSRVSLGELGAFPDDRRWALQRPCSNATFDPAAPKWVHKEHFWCAFTAREELAGLNASYAGGVLSLLGERLDMFAAAGRARLAALLHEAGAGPPELRLVTAAAAGHVHQFGNTGSGVKRRGDTRTVHVVNEASVAAIRDATGLPVTAEVFRPNLVVQGLAPWAEEAWTPGSLVRVGTATLEVISRTVRCDAINVDPVTGERWPGGRDLVAEIAHFFPEVGPYLGFYAQVVGAGALAVGDQLRVAVARAAAGPAPAP